MDTPISSTGRIQHSSNDLDALVVGKLSVDGCPFFIYRFGLVVLELDPPTIKLSGSEVQMHVRVVGIATDGAERDCLGECLLLREAKALFGRTLAFQELGTRDLAIAQAQAALGILEGIEGPNRDECAQETFRLVYPGCASIISDDPQIENVSY